MVEDSTQGKAMSKVDEHREEVIRLLTALHERQKTIFDRLARIDVHLEKLNGKVAEHENSLAIIKTWGSISLIIVPIVINLIIGVMR